MRRVEDGVEVLDRPTPVADRAASLADIERLNAWFGGHALTLRQVARAARCLPPGQAIRVVDVGAGGGGLAIRIARWARRAGRPVRILAVELDADSADLSRHATREYPEVTVVRADAAALPVHAGGVDLVVSLLLLHHLDPPVAVAALGEMARAGRLGFVVNDLWRGRTGVGLVWLATRLLRCHPISRHDGPLSVRRSYSAAELRALAARARVGPLDVRRYPWFVRIIAVGKGSEATPSVPHGKRRCVASDEGDGTTARTGRNAGRPA
jgi:SAM-dependent methyltransferase